MLVEDIIFEANVEPKSLEIIDKTLKKWRDAATEANPGINHDPFFKKLRRDIINDGADKGITAHTTMYGGERNFAMLQPYKPQEDDPDYIKNATDVYQLNVDTKDQYSLQGDPALGVLGGYIEELFGPGMPFNKFSKAVTDPDTPPEIKNKVIPLQKKYEQGKFNLQNLQIKMEEFVKMTRDWRYDPRERQRVEAEAPIIMKFKNGYMWVRLDSKYEMEREGEMMQNCISGYCPAGEGVDLTFGLRDKFNQEVELEDQTDDEAYDWLANWFAENDTDAQDFLSDKQEEEDLQGETHDAVEEVLGMDEDEAFDWMHSQLIDADADIETGELLSGHLIYSLRDKNGESHVSAEYDPNMDMNYPEPTEALGKQNKTAIDKYKPYIEALNDFFGEYPETFGPKGNTRDMPFHPDYDDDLERDEPAESVNEGDLIPNPANTVAIKTMSDGDFYNLSKYMGDLDKATKSEFGSPDSAAVITFQDEEEAEFVLKRIKKHTGLDGDNISGYEDPGDSGTWKDEEGGKEEEKPLSLLGHELKRIKHLAGI